MDIKKAETIIHNTVEITKPRWSQYDQTWKNIDLPFSLREINKGIYTYCSKTESENYGFCRNQNKCKMCNVQNICEMNLISSH